MIVHQGWLEAWYSNYIGKSVLHVISSNAKFHELWTMEIKIPKYW